MGLLGTALPNGRLDAIPGHEAHCHFAHSALCTEQIGGFFAELGDAALDKLALRLVLMVKDASSCELSERKESWLAHCRLQRGQAGHDGVHEDPGCFWTLSHHAVDLSIGRGVAKGSQGTAQLSI